MKISLINPSQHTNYPQLPLGLAYLAAVLEREGHEVSIVDANLENLPSKKAVKSALKDSPDLIGITSMTPEVTEAINVAREFSNKYKLDKSLASAIRPEGVFQESTGYVGIGLVLRWIIDNLTPYNRLFEKARFKDLRIQSQLKKDIRKIIPVVSKAMIHEPLIFILKYNFLI